MIRIILLVLGGFAGLLLYLIIGQLWAKFADWLYEKIGYGYFVWCCFFNSKSVSTVWWILIFVTWIVGLLFYFAYCLANKIVNYEP